MLSENFLFTPNNDPNVVMSVFFCVSLILVYRQNPVLLASERSEQDTLSHSSMENAIRIYIYIYIYRYVRLTLVARSWGYAMWEELSVSHF